MPATALAPGAPPGPDGAGPTAPVVAFSAAATRPAVLRPTLLAAAVGGVQGALLYGGTIALLHARHNPLGGWDAVVLLGWCLLVYGLGGALGSATAMLPLRLWRRLRRGSVAATAAAAARRRDLWLATTAFHFVFWLFTASYGLTYDEAPGWVTSAWPMLAFLVLRSLGVLLLAAAAAWLLLAIGANLARRRRLLPLLVAVAGLLAVGQLALAHPPAPRERPPYPPRWAPRRGSRSPSSESTAPTGE